MTASRPVTGLPSTTTSLASSNVAAPPSHTSVKPAAVKRIRYVPAATPDSVYWPLSSVTVWAMVTEGPRPLSNTVTATPAAGGPAADVTVPSSWVGATPVPLADWSAPADFL